MKHYCAPILIIIALICLFAGCSKEQAEGSSEIEEAREPVLEATAEPENESPEPPEPVEVFYNPLNGELVESDPGNKRPYAVMLNNISVALPQCGISQADIVYEVLAEGGITRLMAVFGDISNVGVLGSIRSVRPYYLDIAKSYDAITVHAGGSEEAYYNISSQGIDVIDGVRGESAEQIFYRDSSRMSAGYEHSLFTNSDLVSEYTPLLGIRREHQGLFSYGLYFADDGTPSGGEDANAISVDFAGHKKTHLTYNAEGGQYLVRQYEKDFIDGNTGENVGFENVLVLYADTVTLADEYGHLDVSLIGVGDGYFACGGKYTEISWRRSSESAPFSYDTSDGERLELGTGRTFIAIVPNVEQTSVVIN